MFSHSENDQVTLIQVQLIVACLLDSIGAISLLHFYTSWDAIKML